MEEPERHGGVWDMNLAYCVIALALAGADDPSLTKTPPRNAPLGIKIEVEPGKPAGESTPAPVIAHDSAAAVAGSLSCAAAMSAAAPTAPSEICHSTCGAAPAPLAKATEPEPQEVWPLTLHDAIRISLDNSESIRVIPFGKQIIPIAGFLPVEAAGAPPTTMAVDLPNGIKPDNSSIVIARLNADASSFRFKSEVMALVRDVERLYWGLARAHAGLWAADRAVSLAQEILNREQAELVVGRGTGADVEEAAQRLEQLNLDLATRTSDVITTERQLRNIVGLPPADNRRIIPVTPPTQARLEPDWEACLDTMMHQQPDIVQQKALTRLAELQLLIARHSGLTEVNLNALDQLNALGQTLDGAEEALMSTFRDGLELGSPKKLKRFKASLARSSAGDPDVLELLAIEVGESGKSSRKSPKSSRAPLANTRQAQYKLIRSRAFLRQVVHQTTHSLARGFLEVDASYKCYARGKGVRDTAEKRLAAQRTYWEEGRITPDRFLDAVDEFAAAATAENQYLAAYNSAIAFLSECKGTLLADHDIIVVESHRPSQSHQTVQTDHDDQTRIK
jgi:outer membrane protein TolC